MFTSVMNAFYSDIAIDLGTANTLVYIPGKGIVLNEPSVVSVQDHGNSKEIIAVGLEAKNMMGRTPDNIKTIRPMRNGAIADFIATEEMIKTFIKRVEAFRTLTAPRIIVSVPAEATPVELRSVFDSAIAAGAKKVYLISEPVAAAIGSKLAVHEPRGSMVVDIGGGTTDIAVLSLGGIIYTKSLRMAGDAMDQSIINFIRNQYQLLIGETSAEIIKERAGTATWKPNGKPLNISIKGRNLRSGMPMDITLGSGEIAEALHVPLEAIADLVKHTLEELPPELASDIIEQGVHLTGGGAMLKNLDLRLSERTGVHFTIVDDPLTCVAIGSGYVLENIEQYKNFLIDYP